MNTRFSYNQLGCSLIKALWLKPADPELLLLHQGPGFLSLHVVLVGQSALHGLHGSFCCLCKQITCRERRVGEGGQRRHQWFLRTIKRKKKEEIGSVAIFDDFIHIHWGPGATFAFGQTTQGETDAPQLPCYQAFLFWMNKRWILFPSRTTRYIVWPGNIPNGLIPRGKFLVVRVSSFLQ